MTFKINKSTFAPNHATKFMASVLVFSYFVPAYADKSMPDYADMSMAEMVDVPLEQLSDIPVSTPSRYQEKTGDTPSTIIVITKKQIQERGYTNLLQVLESLPNIDIQRYASQTWADQISIRGISKNNGFIILQDGIRINSPTSDQIPISNNFPIHYAKQIEIVYGPSSVMYGADALTAVINIITDKGKDIDGVEVKGIVGEYNTYHTQIKAGKQISDNVSVIAGGDYKESDNANLARYYPDKFALTDLKTFNGKTIVNAQNRGGYLGDRQNYSAYAKLTFFQDLDIGINYSFDKHRSDVGSATKYSDYQTNAYLNTELGTVYANYKFAFNQDLGGFLRANYSWTELQPESRFSNVFNDFTKTGGYKYSFGERKQLEGQLEYKINNAHTVSTGFSLEDYYSIPKTADLTAPYNTNQSVAQQKYFYDGTDNTLPLKIYQLRYNNVAGYLQWNAKWHEMLSTTVAMRYDVNSQYNGTFNPKLGLVFKPTDTITTKFLYGTAFLAPAPVFAYSHFGTFSGKSGDTYTSDFFQLPNSNLKPEKIETFEFNVDYQPDKNLNIGVNLYRNNLKDILANQVNTVPISDYIPGGFIKNTQQYVNIGELISYGGDIHFDHQTAFDDSVLKLWGNYSYLNGNVSRKDQNFATHLPMTSPNKVKLGLTYTYQDKYTITPTLYWTDRMTGAQVEPGNKQVLQTVPSYWRFDLYAKAEVFKNFSLFVNVNNLLDRRYYNSGDSTSASMVASPQDPRTVSGGFIYKFGE